MAGVKGRSGRKTRGGELRIAELANMAVSWAIKHFDTLDTETKIKIVNGLAAKYVPQNVKAELSGRNGGPIEISWMQ